MNTANIINDLEDFFEVWSDGVSGNVIEVQQKLSDLETISKQTARGVIKNPQVLRAASCKVQAEEEKAQFEQTGLRCKLIHVGPLLLSKFSEKSIEQFLEALPGGIGSANIREVKPGSYALYSNDERVWVDHEDVEFYFYLSCLRYLARLGRVEHNKQMHTDQPSAGR